MQNPGGPAASPASAGPPSGDFREISLAPGSGDDIQTPSFGIHVSSWRDYEQAFGHCERLQKQGFETWVNQVDLGSKGIWYRVLVGRFDSKAEAAKGRPDVLAVLGLDSAMVFERVMPNPDATRM